MWQGPKYASRAAFIIYLGKYAFLWTFEIGWPWKACSKLTKKNEIRDECTTGGCLFGNLEQLFLDKFKVQLKNCCKDYCRETTAWFRKLVFVSVYQRHNTNKIKYFYVYYIYFKCFSPSYCLQIWRLIFSECKQTNKLLSPLKPPKNHRFSDEVRGNRTQLILLHSLYIRSKIWWRSLEIILWEFSHLVF